jgi:hypothetical protein
MVHQMIYYFNLLPNPFHFNTAAESRTGPAAVSAAAVQPAAQQEEAAADRSHAELVAELDALIAANNAACEDPMPLFLRSA